MNTFLFRSLLLVSCTAIAMSSFASAKEYGSGHITVKRAANFGQNIDLVAYVDSHRVAWLAFGQTYSARISAGRQEVTTTTSSNLKVVPVTKHIVVAPGKSNQFTGGFHGHELVLQ